MASFYFICYFIRKTVVSYIRKTINKIIWSNYW